MAPSLPSDHYEVVVVGGGQAGLAIGYHLARQGRRFTILEAAPHLAASWRTRWDSLKLFTPVRYNALPGRKFPGDPDTYPGRDEVIEYLSDYARHFELPVVLNSRVESVRGDGDGYAIELVDRTYQADQVVVATGPFQVPFVPPITADLDSQVVQLHSTEYRSPEVLPAGQVLVVGGGNTGFQIAKELSATHRVSLAVGSRQMPLPQRFLGRDLFWWLTKTRLIEKTVDSRIGRRARQRDTLIGSSPRELTRRYGVDVKPRVVGASGRQISFADGSGLDVDAVIWATGYRSDYSWIAPPVLGPDGRLRHRRGVTEVPGLFFLGLTWQHSRGSALIGWVKDDAEFVAAQVAANRMEASSERETRESEDARAGRAAAATEGV
jgi:putative flavoprotein involved in K+ transport